MGWWSMNANGGIGRDRGQPEVMGDGPADIMDSAISKIVKEYTDCWGRKPTLKELQGCFDFCSFTYEDK